MTNKNLTIGLVVVAIIAIIGLFTPQGKALLGAAIDSATTFGKIGTAELKVGTNCDNGFKYSGCTGTKVSAITFGACTIWAPANTITASTTQQIVCQNNTDGTIGALSGLTASSNCTFTMASSTNTNVLSIALEGTSASSTAGTIVGRLANFTGTTFTWSAAASSSAQWNYQCYN